MEELVIARHKVTGLIQEIPKSHLELIPAFELIEPAKEETEEAPKATRKKGVN